jgi:hypothetical protein
VKLNTVIKRLYWLFYWSDKIGIKNDRWKDRKRKICEAGERLRGKER